MLPNIFAHSLWLGTALGAVITPPILTSTQQESSHIRTNLTADEKHAQILSSTPAEKIITSDQLSAYLTAHQNEDTAAYLSDNRTWIVIDPSNTNSTELGPRQEWCTNYYKVTVLQTQAFWGPWQPVSGCSYNTHGSGALHTSLSWSYSKTISGNLGISITAIKDILSGSLGFSISETWTNGGSFTCDINKGDTGQVWGRHHMAWATVQKSQCSQCYGCNPPSATGYTIVPDATPNLSQGLGCSSGAYVTC